jgi:hypothetical protein
MAGNSQVNGPHQAIDTDNARDRFTLRLFDTLWDQYCDRVEYVRTYAKVVAEAGGQFVNDHIALRTFACQQPTTGIVSLSRIFEALGYQAANCYQFTNKHLGAIHFQHPHPDFPKIFISELKVWELAPEAQEMVSGSLASHREPLSNSMLSSLQGIGQHDVDEPQLMDQLVNWFIQLPWAIPDKQDVLAVNEISQYAAWVLVHGYNVNHFTSLINSHGVVALDDIEKTIDALKAAQVPMKAEIEGARGSKLRQSATEAVVIDVDVCESGQPSKMPWTYAYFELAERGEVADPDTGKRHRFEGFLGPQATQLFEMTKKS